MTSKITKTEAKRRAEAERARMIALMGEVAAGNAQSRVALAAEAEHLARRISGGSFAALIDAAGGYWPTLRADLDPMAAVLADLYDFEQARRGDSRRAYRG